ncbi:MAG: riboflavin synthase [Solirubrobacterales bacterium]|nr:riboflavin synthase [Solirubrobacterales bacterium]
MFTGLIAELGSVESIERNDSGARLRIAADVGGELSPGDSIAVSGACLTAVDPGPGGFSADVMNQTLDLTALGALEPGSRVNLEPALRASDRLGGHIVQGHVDGTGRVAGIAADGFARRVRVELPPGLERYVVEHGSIALNGVSLTVAAIDGRIVEVSLIPETLERTTFGTITAGDPVNVEVDLIARHAERLLKGFEVSNGK